MGWRSASEWLWYSAQHAWCLDVCPHHKTFQFIQKQRRVITTFHSNHPLLFWEKLRRTNLEETTLPFSSVHASTCRLLVLSGVKRTCERYCEARCTLLPFFLISNIIFRTAVWRIYLLRYLFRHLFQHCDFCWIHTVVWTMERCALARLSCKTSKHYHYRAKIFWEGFAAANQLEKQTQLIPVARPWLASAIPH